MLFHYLEAKKTKVLGFFPPKFLQGEGVGALGFSEAFPMQRQLGSFCGSDTGCAVQSWMYEPHVTL